MSIHNMSFGGELMKIILELSSYTLLICSTAELLDLTRMFNLNQSVILELYEHCLILKQFALEEESITEPFTESLPLLH